MMNSRITGPTPLPQSVREAVNQQMSSHRSQEFKTIFENSCINMQALMNTSSMPMFFTSSGTGGLEAAIVNTLGKTSKVLALSAGYYGDLFAAIAKKHLADGVQLEQFSPGTRIEPLLVKKILQMKQFDAVLLTHTESSTGVINPLAELTGIIREHSDALILVDAVSSLGTTEFRMDDWGVDVVITVPQKGLMAPPGLAILCASDRAIKKARGSDIIGSYYFDFNRMLEANIQKQTPFTPAITSIWGIHAALALMQEEGFDNIHKRHASLSAQCQAGVLAAGFELFAMEGARSPGITAVKIPQSQSAQKIQEKLEQDYGLLVAVGAGWWKDQVIRIGHMGFVSEQNIQAVNQALMHLNTRL
ncbi:MAG: alanine--glyoxylate aminotransferase family protein [Tatlockia sp.]|nr:alanine--glyoxylate aminotransferase family protein [Tatlockia sp.]